MAAGSRRARHCHWRQCSLSTASDSAKLPAAANCLPGSHTDASAETDAAAAAAKRPRRSSLILLRPHNGYRMRPPRPGRRRSRRRRRRQAPLAGALMAAVNTTIVAALSSGSPARLRIGSNRVRSIGGRAAPLRSDQSSRRVQQQVLDARTLSNGREPSRRPATATRAQQVRLLRRRRRQRLIRPS